MAEQLPSFDFDVRLGQLFPEEWFNGYPWRLEQGPDFQMKMKSLQACYGRAARARGRKVRSQILDEKTIVVMAIEPSSNGRYIGQDPDTMV